MTRKEKKFEELLTRHGYYNKLSSFNRLLADLEAAGLDRKASSLMTLLIKAERWGASRP